MNFCSRQWPKLDFLITKFALRCIISEAQPRPRTMPVSCSDDVECLVRFQREVHNNDEMVLRGEIGQVQQYNNYCRYAIYTGPYLERNPAFCVLTVSPHHWHRIPVRHSADQHAFRHLVHLELLGRLPS